MNYPNWPELLSPFWSQRENKVLVVPPKCTTNASLPFIKYASSNESKYLHHKQASVTANRNKGWLSRGLSSGHRLLLGYRCGFMLMQPEVLSQHITLGAHHRGHNQKHQCKWITKSMTASYSKSLYRVKELQHPLLLVKGHCGHMSLPRSDSKQGKVTTQPKTITISVFDSWH